MTRGFPNLFMITGPQSPSVLSNMMVSIEQHVDWIMRHARSPARSEGFEAIEPTQTAEAAWVQHDERLRRHHPLPPRQLLVHGRQRARASRGCSCPTSAASTGTAQVCDEVVAQGYLGFEFGDGRHRVQRRRDPPPAAGRRGDARDDGRARAAADGDDVAGGGASVQPGRWARQRPPGPEVGEIVDGDLPGADGPLALPPLPAGHARAPPVVVYFHGGGWVIGDQHVRRPAVPGPVRSLRRGHRVGRLPPRPRGTRSPRPVDDAFAAVNWIAEHPGELGGIPGELAVAGWSAGANLAAVVCQLAETGRCAPPQRAGADLPGHRPGHVAAQLHRER